MLGDNVGRHYCTELPPKQSLSRPAEASLRAGIIFYFQKKFRIIQFLPVLAYLMIF
jgi:hypothetical protein